MRFAFVIRTFDKSHKFRFIGHKFLYNFVLKRLFAHIYVYE